MGGMTDRLTFSFPYSPTEHAAALGEQMGGIRFFLIEASVFISAGIYAIVVKKLPVGFTLAAIGIMAVVNLPIPLLMRRWQRRKFARENADQIGKLQTRTFAHDGFRPTDRWRQPIPWAKVVRITETRRFFMIYGGSDGPFFIPKHAMSSEEQGQLRAFLRLQLHDQPKRLRLLAPVG